MKFEKVSEKKKQYNWNQCSKFIFYLKKENT